MFLAEVADAAGWRSCRSLLCPPPHARPSSEEVWCGVEKRAEMSYAELVPSPRPACVQAVSLFDRPIRAVTLGRGALA